MVAGGKALRPKRQIEINTYLFYLLIIPVRDGQQPQEGEQAIEGDDEETQFKTAEQ